MRHAPGERQGTKCWCATTRLVRDPKCHSQVIHLPRTRRRLSRLNRLPKARIWPSLLNRSVLMDVVRFSSARCGNGVADVIASARLYRLTTPASDLHSMRAHHQSCCRALEHTKRWNTTSACAARTRRPDVSLLERAPEPCRAARPDPGTGARTCVHQRPTRAPQRSLPTVPAWPREGAHPALAAHTRPSARWTGPPAGLPDNVKRRRPSAEKSNERTDALADRSATHCLLTALTSMIRPRLPVNARSRPSGLTAIVSKLFSVCPAHRECRDGLEILEWLSTALVTLASAECLGYAPMMPGMR